MREFVVAVEEKLYAAEARLLRLELKAPFYSLGGRGGGVEGGFRTIWRGSIQVCDFGGHLVRGDPYMVVSFKSFDPKLGLLYRLRRATI